MIRYATSILLALMVSAGCVTGPPGRHAGADIERLKLAIATDPQSADAWVALGWHLYRGGRYGEAERVMTKARQLRPNDPYVLWLSGIVSYVLGDFAASKVFLKKVYFDFNQLPDAIQMDITFDLLGRIYLEEEEGDLLIASYYFAKAADLAPDNWQYHFLLGFAEWYRLRPYEALTSFKKAKELNPNNAVVLSKYAWALVAVQERWGEEPGPERYREAIAATQEAMAADPNNYENYELLGIIFAKQKRNEDAIEALRRAISLDPKAAGPRFYLAKFLLRVGTDTAAQEAERQLIRAIANSPDFWVGPRDGPHITLLIAHFINTGRLREAGALTDWERRYRAAQR